MARAAWAAKGQLLAAVRPHAHIGQHGGMAPLSLVSDICGHLRGFTPAELRVVLAAFARHPADSPGLLLTPAAEAKDHTQSRQDSRSSSPVQLADAVMQLLIGGSRLGNSEQLLATAEAIALYAPCRSSTVSGFWTVFCERASRMCAQNGLDAQQLSRLLALSSCWQRRCGCERVPSTWPHLLRSAGGRLAPHVDSLSLEEAVEVARNAAHCGEPQRRLVAAIGTRVGQAHGTDELYSQDLVDLIGASAKLGGKLHMMTRSLADILENRVVTLEAPVLVQLCAYLGALEMFPQRLTSALELVLPSRLTELDLASLMALLRASGQLRWRVPSILAPLLEELRANLKQGTLSAPQAARLMYELYRLDLWDEDLVERAIGRLVAGVASGPAHETEKVTPKAAVNTLLAVTYFSLPSQEVYKALILELMRAKDLPQSAIYQLRTVELALRVGHASVSFREIGRLAARWLFSIRQSATVPEARGESEFAEEVSEIADRISWHHETEVEIGPYVLDFAAVSESDDGSPPPEFDKEKGSKAMLQSCVALEADGPSHFYRPHGQPWHWTSNSKLRHRILTAAGVRVAHVPYYDWAALDTPEEKEEYLGRLLLQAQRQSPRIPGALQSTRLQKPTGRDALGTTVIPSQHEGVFTGADLH